MASTTVRYWNAAGRRDRYRAYVPDKLADLDLILTRPLRSAVQAAEAALSELNQPGQALASLTAISQLLLRAESIASRRTARPVARPVGEDDVLSDVQAMASAVESLSRAAKVTVAAFLDVHRELMRGTDGADTGGVIRSTQNWLGDTQSNPCDAVFVPPPPEHVPELLEDLVAFLDTPRYPAVVQCALAHMQLEAIHPFKDGNGRAGRMLIHVVLRRTGVAPCFVPPISLVLTREWPTYTAALRATAYRGASAGRAAQSALRNWIALFASATLTAAADAARFAQQAEHLATQLDLAAASDAEHLAAGPFVRFDTPASLVASAAGGHTVEELAQAGVLAMALVCSAGADATLTSVRGANERIEST